MTFIDRHYRIIFLMILALGIFMRIIDLGKESFRLDETQTIWQSSHSLEFIKNYSAQNVHLPLFDVLANLWMKLGFVSESTLRILPVIFGVLTLPFVYLLAYEILGNRRSALITLLFASVSPFLIWYSRETRPYALLILMSVMSYFVFLKAQKKPGVFRYLLLTVINILGIYTHYFFTLVLLVEFLYALFRRSKIIPLLASFTISVCALTPWAVYFLINNKGGDLSPSLAYPGGIQVIVAVFELIFGFQPQSVTVPSLAMWPLAYLVGFLFLARRNFFASKELLLATIAAFAPTLVLVALTYLYKPMFLSRYISFSTPAILILATWLLTNLAGKLRSISVVIFFLLMAGANYPQYFFNDIGQKENYRDAMSYINQNAGYRDVVVVSPLYTIYPAQYYYRSVASLTTIPAWDRTKLNLPSPTAAVLRTDSELIKSGHQRIFLLSTLNLDGGQQTKDFMDKNYSRLVIKQFSPFVWVSVYQAEYTNSTQNIADAQIK